ncbi:MAG: LytR C-terminal domain-containing protein [Candidatus Microgenomates bacterium]|jgi:hypothetical protein
MEDSQNQETQTQQTPKEVNPTPATQGVSFPTVGEPKKSGGAKTLLIVGVLILVGILGFVIYKSATSKSETTLTQPSPFDNLTNPSQEQTAPTPVPSPTATINRSGVKIQVQNGTGITGEAAYLQTQLKGLGYTNIVVGNSSQQNLTATQVSFSSSLSSDAVTEITNKLNSIYQSVTTSASVSTTYDVVIVTGLRKGATAKPSATPAATPTATIAPTSTPTSTP